MYRQFLKIDINQRILKALVASGRLRWSQQADRLAIGKAIDKLMQDIVAGTEPVSEKSRETARRIFWNPP
jgi:hypothetical protein